jgi:putative redox protein
LTKLYANAKLVKGFRIDVDDGRSHAMCLDLPLHDDGTDMGPSALELALMSHAGCYATTFALTARKMRITLKDLEVKSEGIKTEEAGTITEVSLDVLVKTDAKEDRVQRIHELTVKSCPVGKIFDGAGTKTIYKIRSEKE